MMERIDVYFYCRVVAYRRHEPPAIRNRATSTNPFNDEASTTHAYKGMPFDLLLRLINTASTGSSTTRSGVIRELLNRIYTYIYK